MLYKLGMLRISNEENGGIRPMKGELLFLLHIFLKNYNRLILII